MRVLIVDDHPDFGRHFKGLMLDKGGIGSLFVRTLGEAADLLEERVISFDAVLADWDFATGEDRGRNLFDGLDLLGFVNKIAPELRTYVLTAQYESPGFKAKIASVGYDMDNVIKKNEIPLTDETEQTATAAPPWRKVRADIMVGRAGEVLADGAREKVKLSAATGNIANLLDKNMPPVSTFVEELEGGYRLKKPIEIVCVPDSNEDGTALVRASAPKLGLLVEAFGETPSQAIEALQLAIREQADDVFSANDDELVGFGKTIKESFQDYMEPIDAAAQ